MQNHQKVASRPEIMAQLEQTVEDNNRRTYHKILKQVDWQLASAEEIDQAVGVALSFLETKQAKDLTEIGHKRFPEHEQLERTWRMFNPPPPRFGRRKGPRKLQASMDWITEHAEEYEPGPVKAGELVADAPTLKELRAVVKAKFDDPEFLATNSIVFRVRS